MKQEEKHTEEEKKRHESIETFVDSQVGISAIAKRKLTEAEEENSYMKSRKKKIDDTDKDVKVSQLKEVSPWIVQFTPSAKAADIKEPPKRPPSPFTGRPLRPKDLIPLNLEAERSDNNTIGSAGALRYVCSVSRYHYHFNYFPPNKIFLNFTPDTFIFLEKQLQTKKL